ncbi:MAG: lysophospholipid acyltransferase family protein, partial [Gammaproteobacteria bacterium]|nr:lysophospholipid acyltransferase family protein [Gammaproteobacteria bacterium]
MTPTPPAAEVSLINRFLSAWVWVALFVLSLLPWSACHRLGRMTGWLNYRLQTRAARVTRVNLKLCLPEKTGEELERLVLRSLQASAQTAFETPKVWLNNWQRTLAHVRCVEGESLLQEAMAADDGLIIVLPHLGNWEVYNVFMRARGRMTALYLPSRQPYLASVMARVRSLYGNEMVPANRSGVARLYKRLQEGKVVSILPDQVPGSGEFVPFFGVKALTDTLTWRLLNKTRANVLSLHIIRRQKPFGFDVHIRAVPKSIYAGDRLTSLTVLNDTMEKCARECLAQYQWDYKRFRERPAGEKKVYA